MAIKEIIGQVIHDSRGDATIQVNVITTSGKVGSAAIPAGVAVGMFEAKTLEPTKALEVLQNEIAPALVGSDPADQAGLDKTLIELDATADKSRLGANTVLAVSMATSRAAAAEQNLPLYRYIGALDKRSGFTVPIPMFNLIEGGKHANNNLDIQEFMVVPDRLTGFHNQLSAGKLIFSTLGQLIRGEAVTVPTGDEGGYAPNLDTNEMAIDLLVQAITASGYAPWDEVSLALDVAADTAEPTFEISSRRYLGLLKDYPLLSLEDPFGQKDWTAWSSFNQEMQANNATTKKLLLVGDDLYASNIERLRKGVQEKATNAVLIKMNQIGTLTEALATIEVARSAGYVVIISHRSGETLDDYIADFAVGVGAQFIKSGAPNDAHPERMSKYRRLLTIEQELTPA